MKRWLIAIVLPALAAIGAGQQRMKVDINGGTPEGLLLQQIGTDRDAVAEQWISAYQRTGNRDRTDKARRAAIPLVKDNDQLPADAGRSFEKCAEKREGDSR